ncbi:VOC family protein [Allorhizobium sp. BGMRC 0089]|uniref:VOC family protein n=1 Tax=Allorhizobium sonneratiae TaxID=2934936 RepID=UPI0020335434|nr:VOC family protein [Allorhizobium sonneratiae]MCM2292411.1 VOC family protein [Allorhizobium sonneratiae]
MSATTAYVEHTAFFVRDIIPLIDFFTEVLGMGITKYDGTPEAPTQVWLQGGIQLIADPDFSGPEGRFAHLGIVCKDVPAAIEAARARGAVSTAKGDHWLKLGDGLLLEFLPEKGNAVDIIRSHDPRI